jgi:hypothetical protein
VLTRAELRLRRAFQLCRGITSTSRILTRRAPRAKTALATRKAEGAKENGNDNQSAAAGASGFAGTGSTRCARQAPKIPRAGLRVLAFGDDPSRKRFGTPRRRQSVPRVAFGVAMLALPRLPFYPVAGSQSVPRLQVPLPRLRLYE